MQARTYFDKRFGYEYSRKIADVPLRLNLVKEKIY